MNQILKNSLFALVLLGACVTVHADDAEATKVVRDFFDSWHSFDIDKIMSFVSDNCHYENVPSLTGENPVIIGREKMREFLAPFFAKDPLVVSSKFRTEVKDVFAGGGSVGTERVDHFEIGNSKFALPVAGLFKVKDGKIVYWIDYFNGDTINPVLTLMTGLMKK